MTKNQNYYIMSNEAKEKCRENCRKVYEECLRAASGNPTAKERCEKFNKRCKDGCKDL